MEKVFTGQDEMEANFVCIMLQEMGYQASVLGGILSSARGELPFIETTLPAVWVKEEDVAAVMPIVEEYVKNRYERAHAGEEGQGVEITSDSETWTCGTCGETVGGKFAMCWNCQTPRPGVC